MRSADFKGMVIDELGNDADVPKPDFFNLHCPVQRQRCKGTFCAAYIKFEDNNTIGYCGMVHRA